MKTLYILDHKLKWKVFKRLIDELTRDSGPTPKNLEKVLWEMLRKKKIYCGYTKEISGDMWIGLKIPKGFKIILIRNP